MSLLDETKAELARVKGELAARAAAIRAPLLAAQARAAAKKAELENLHAAINAQKRQTNTVGSRRPVMASPAHLARLFGLGALGTTAVLEASEAWWAWPPIVLFGGLVVFLVSVSRE